MTGRPRDEQLSFRPMVREDLPDLQTWMAAPHVAQWWGDDSSDTIQAVEAKYAERVDGTNAVSPWVMEIEGRPVGFIQWYRVEDEADWFPGLDIPPGTVAIDVAIGDPDYVGKGHGRRLVLEFVHHVIRTTLPDCPEVWIDPDWYADQESTDPLPSAGVPTVVPLRATSVLVGRTSRSRGIHPDIDLAADNGISRRHCQLTTDGTRWWVEDLGSSNGTYLGSAVGPLPKDPLPAGEKREIAPDARVYLGAWTRIVIRRAQPGEV